MHLDMQQILIIEKREILLFGRLGGLFVLGWESLYTLPLVEDFAFVKRVLNIFLADFSGLGFLGYLLLDSLLELIENARLFILVRHNLNINV